MMATIHATPVIEDGAVIGNNADIGPHAVIFRHTTIGPNCRIHAGAVIGDLPQDLAFRPTDSFVRFGADCVVREHVTIHRGTKPGTATVVGDGCYLMANSHLAHNVRLGNRVVVANGALLAGYVEVGDEAFISGNVVVHQFVHIGRLTMLSGGCGIGKDVPPFCTTIGIQRNSIGGLNTIGMKRSGLSPAERMQVKQAFSFLYRSNLNVSQALDRTVQPWKSSNSSPLPDAASAPYAGAPRKKATIPDAFHSAPTGGVGRRTSGDSVLTTAAGSDNSARTLRAIDNWNLARGDPGGGETTDEPLESRKEAATRRAHPVSRRDADRPAGVARRPPDGLGG